MEIYNQNNSDYPSPDNDSSSRPFFPTGELNFRTPMWEKIVFLLWGYLGLSLISTILQVILTAVVSVGIMNEDTANTVLMFVTYALLAGGFLLLICLDKRKTFFTIFKGFKDKDTYIYAAIAFALVLFVNYFFSILYRITIPDLYNVSANQSGVSTEVKTNPVLMFFAVVIFAPFCEELTYRVGIVDTIGKKNRWLGIIISAIVFGFIHFGWTYLTTYMSLSVMDPNDTIEVSGVEVLVSELTKTYAQYLIVELLNLPLYILPGFVFAFIYAKSGKITSTMLAHLTINLISFIEMVASMCVNTNGFIFSLRL